MLEGPTEKWFAHIKFNNVDSKATHFNKNNYIMKSTVDNYEKNTINNMSQTKVHTKGRRRGEFKN